MKQRIIIGVLNILVIFVALSFFLNSTLIAEISPVTMGGEMIDTNVLEKVIKHLKILIAIPTLICICISFILVAINKKVTMYASIVLTIIAVIMLIGNIVTFDDKIVSKDINGDPVLSASAKLVLYKIETGSYDNKAEYVENLLDIAK